MSKINVDTWEPESGTAATLMASGDTVTVPSGATLTIASGATLTNSGTATGFTAGLLGLVVYTGDGTYSPGDTDNGTAGDEGSASVTKVIIEVQGGGGGGSKGTGGTYVICGSAGGYAKKFIDVSSMKTEEESATITVGSAGAGKSVSGAGGDGGDSSWVSTGEVSLTVTGVKGVGAYSSYGTATGGAATNGDINIKGGDGYNNTNARGGDSMFGCGGGNGWTGETVPGVGSGYGSGGGGGMNVNSAAGAPGLLLIWEYA